MRRAVVIAAAALLAGYLGLCGLAFALQRSLTFPAPQQGSAPAPPAEVVQVPGGTLLLWRAPPTPEAPVVVHFHGNAEQVADNEFLAALFVAGGSGFAAVEYPGYGLAAGRGSPSEDALVEAGEKALQHLVGPLGIARERLVLSGQSVGTGVAVALAAKGWGTRLLLVSPYTSLPDVAAGAFPFLPVRWLMRDRFDSASRAPGIQVPVLVVHGRQDEVIPYALGERLAALFPSAKLVSVDTRHNDVWQSVKSRSEATLFAAGAHHH